MTSEVVTVKAGAGVGLGPRLSTWKIFCIINGGGSVYSLVPYLD